MEVKSEEISGEKKGSMDCKRLARGLEFHIYVISSVVKGKSQDPLLPQIHQCILDLLEQDCGEQ